MLLTQKANVVSAPEGVFDLKDLYRKQWRHVQCLADIFWKRWRQEYLTTLQSRKKWINDKRDMQVGDIVLLKDDQPSEMNGLLVSLLRTSLVKIIKSERWRLGL